MKSLEFNFKIKYSSKTFLNSLHINNFNNFQHRYSNKYYSTFKSANTVNYNKTKYYKLKLLYKLNLHKFSTNNNDLKNKQNVFTDNVHNNKDYLHISQFDKDMKYTLLESNFYNKSIIDKFKFFVFYPISGLFGYKLFYKIYSLKIFGTLFYGCLFIFMNRLIANLNSKSSNFITKINLFSDGRRCEIITANKKSKFIVDISCIRKIQDNEKKAFEHILGKNLMNFIPIVINNSVYLLSKKSVIANNAVFKNTIESKYIEIRHGYNNNDDSDNLYIDKNNTIDL